jgi:hypothetical protein
MIREKWMFTSDEYRHRAREFLEDASREYDDERKAHLMGLVKQCTAAAKVASRVELMHQMARRFNLVEQLGPHLRDEVVELVGPVDVVRPRDEVADFL